MRGLSQAGRQLLGQARSRSKAATEAIADGTASTSGRTAAEWSSPGMRWYAAESAGSPIRHLPVSYISLALTFATGGGVFYYYDRQRQAKQAELLKSSQVVGKAAIGGPFQLTEASSGRPFTDKDLLGKHALLYFGFTFCPDICPEELEKLAAALDSLDRRVGEAVQPVFITLDPERDHSRQVAEYVKEFHPRLIGLTGSPEQVQAAARAYRVYYTKTNDSPTDYLIDHSIIMYLIDPKGNFVTFFGKNYTTEQLAASIGKYVKEAGAG